MTFSGKTVVRVLKSSQQMAVANKQSILMPIGVAIMF